MSPMRSAALNIDQRAAIQKGLPFTPRLRTWCSDQKIALATRQTDDKVGADRSQIEEMNRSL